MAPYSEPYDVADYLDSDEMIAAYLTEELSSEDARVIAKALLAVARARGGIAQLAASTGIAAADLGRALDTGNPDLATMLKVLHSFGVKLSASIAAQEAVAA